MHLEAQSRLQESAAAAEAARRAAEAELMGKITVEEGLRRSLEESAEAMRAAREEVERVKALQGAEAEAQSAARAKVRVRGPSIIILFSM